MKGTVLLPSYVINEPNWKNILQPFLQFYSHELPCNHSVDSEFMLWKKMWHEQWESHWKSIQEQHLHTVGIQWRSQENIFTEAKFIHWHN